MSFEVKKILGFGVLLSLLLSADPAHGQSVKEGAKKHFDSARSYDATGDARAEQEYRQAIAEAKGRYPDAWEWLSYYLAKKLRFTEAADAWRSYLKHRSGRVRSNDSLRLRLLERAGELKSRSESLKPLSADEMVELVELVERFGTQTDAFAFAENAVKLHPESAKALVTLANLIKTEQGDRALELLNRAVAFANQEAFVFNARGWYYLWSHKPVEAEIDLREAIELSNGSSSSSWLGLGDALARQGRQKEAIEAYRKYLKMRPENASHYDEVIKRSIQKLQTEP